MGVLLFFFDNKKQTRMRRRTCKMPPHVNPSLKTYILKQLFFFSLFPFSLAKGYCCCTSSPSLSFLLLSTRFPFFLFNHGKLGSRYSVIVSSFHVFSSHFRYCVFAGRMSGCETTTRKRREAQHNFPIFRIKRH